MITAGKLFSRLTFKATALLSLFALGSLVAQEINVPNGSFENPSTTFVDTNVGSWQKTPKPDWFDEEANGPWDQLIGVFANTAPTETNYIHNIHGTQGIYFFALPTAGIFQDYNSIDYAHTEPSHEFNVSFEPGNSYSLNFGLIGGGGGMNEGASILASIYYLDDTNGTHVVASTNVVYEASVFPDATNFVYFNLTVPKVNATNDWAGKKLGLSFVSTVAAELAAGYWDLDHVTLRKESVPNGSFESPRTQFVDTRVDLWEKFPKPDWFDEEANGPWDQLVGVFANTAPTETNYIHNIDGDQAIYIFASPQAGIFQDYNSLDWAHTEPAHAFDFTYEAGTSYSLKLGVLGGGGGMVEGASLLAGLYYRDEIGNMVTVASTNIVYTPQVFPDQTNFVDFEILVPAVSPSESWAGKKIGVQIVSTSGFDKAGGYWDIDNVRLETIPQVGEAQATLTVQQEGEGVRVSWTNVTSVQHEFKLQKSRNLSDWEDVGLPIGVGESSRLVPSGEGFEFFRIVGTPIP